MATGPDLTSSSAADAASSAAKKDRHIVSWSAEVRASWWPVGLAVAEFRVAFALDFAGLWIWDLGLSLM